MAQRDVIDLHDVAKIYRKRIHALRGVSMRIAEGEMFGLLGPNGAGKSTLVKIITAIVHPTRASGTVLGQPVGHKPALAQVGYLPENHQLPDYLTGRQVVEYYGALTGLDRPTRKQRAAELLETVGMKPWADQRTGRYSKGMLQRIGLAQAMVHDPQLLILDEPTDGLDPAGRREVRDILRQRREQGRTVFINSHLLSELEMICDRVAILTQGEIVRQGSLEELTEAQRRYEIKLADDYTDEQSAQRLRQTLETGARQIDGKNTKALADGQPFALENGLIHVGTTDAATLQPMLDALRAAEWTIESVQPHRQSLEDLFLEVTEPQGAGAAPPTVGATTT